MGKVYPTGELLTKLRRVNAQLHAPSDGIFPYLVQGARIVGLYWGDPANVDWTTGQRKQVKFICSMPADFVPEFTQVGPQGVIIAKGWRAVLEKTMKAGAATRAALELEFGTTLAREDRDVACPRCRENGQVVRGEGASGLCAHHEYVRVATAYRERMVQDECGNA